MKATTENAFESYIEETLLSGTSGWKRGTNSEWDFKRAIFPVQIIAFIKETQLQLYSQLFKEHGPELDSKIISALVKELEIKGTLHILRHGFKFFGKIFKLGYFKPAHKLNPEIIELYKKNNLTVTRQVQCHPVNYETVDLVFSINGLPVATCEVKNPGTGQTWKNAIKQYKDRDWRFSLFRYKHSAVIHFAADPDEIYSTTRLSGDKTWFLPFNRGSHPGEIKCGAGNPQHSSGHRTGYFWEEVLQRDSFLDIIGNFMFIEMKEEVIDIGGGVKKRIVQEKMIFPRYHQLDSVRRLVEVSRLEGVGNNYLIEHSAGSGKTNSIAWLSHRMASLHNDIDQKIFDCVIVITDRKVLDRMLQDAIYQIEHAQGVVKLIDEDSKQLAEALVDGTKIVVTTLQKFPFVLKGLLHIAGAESVDNPDQESIDKAQEWKEQIAKRKYAIIVDEAHSSQTGETARELKEILGSGMNGENEEVEYDWEDRLNQVMESRGPQRNLSFYAFTATPKGKTLQLFGRIGSSGKHEAFHNYSMRQAIEEGFILNVLQNYTTYNTFFKLVKSIEEDPTHSKRKAAKALGKFMTLHPVNIEQKTELIIEHFRDHVKNRIGGKAKAMLVTSSRLHAVRYMLAFQRYIERNHYSDVRPLVAFSGKVTDPDTTNGYTEPGMNVDYITGKNIGELQLPDRFGSPDYQILLVANKYQTGFDQPLLHTMYVDKRLDGVQAVQTLSRLNRTYPGKESPFVLDFVNDGEDIYKAFKPYFDSTLLDEEADPAQLEIIKHELDSFQVYYWSEVEAFAQIFYKRPELQNPGDHARMQKHIQPSVDRFKAIDLDSAKMFRDKLASYVHLYSFISQILNYNDVDLEILYSFSRYLLPHLPTDRNTEIINAGEEVSLQYYRLERVMSGSIALEDGEIYGVKSPIDVGSGKSKDEKKPLSEIIEILNERFGTNFTEEDRLFFEQIKEKAINNEKIIQTATANPLDKFELGIRSMIEGLMIQRMADNDEIVTRYMENSEFQNAVFPVLAREIYDIIIKKQENLPKEDQK